MEAKGSAKILLLADINGPDALEDADIVEQLGCLKDAVVRRRKRFAETRVSKIPSLTILEVDVLQ